MDEIVWGISLGWSSPGEIVWDWSGVKLCRVEGLFWGGDCLVSDETLGWNYLPGNNLGWNCLGWNCPGWSCLGWNCRGELSGVELSRVELSGVELFDLQQNSRVELFAWK